MPQGLQVKVKPFETSKLTATDTEPFAQAGIPTLSVTTGAKSPYHKPGDDAHLIDYNSMVLITQHLTNVLIYISRSETFQSSGKIAAKHDLERAKAKIRLGVAVNIGSNYHYYTAGALNGKEGGFYSVGMWSQFNMGFVALRPEMYYERVGAKHPNGTMWTNAITLPLNVVLLRAESDILGADIYLGGYYSYKFSGSLGNSDMDFNNDFYRNEGGLSFGFGVRASKIKLTLTYRMGLSNLNRQPFTDNANLRNRSTLIGISYIFK